MTRARAAASAGLLACLAACAAPRPAEEATLPEYARPHGRVLSANEATAHDLVRYRPLARADFLADVPPPHLAPHRDDLGAALCAHLAPRPEMRVRLRRVGGGAGGVGYRAEALDLHAEAAMDRGCSWWNDEQTKLPPDYVLEHEQIHFALFELEARRFNRRASGERGALAGEGATSQEAVEALHAAVEAALLESLDEALRLNREFDEDTSMGFRPDRQQLWLERVERELSEHPSPTGERP